MDTPHGARSGIKRAYPPPSAMVETGLRTRLRRQVVINSESASQIPAIIDAGKFSCRIQVSTTDQGLPKNWHICALPVSFMRGHRGR